MPTYTHAEIDHRCHNYVAFWACYDNGDRIFCYSDLITQSDRFPYPMFRNTIYDNPSQDHYDDWLRIFAR